MGNKTTLQKEFLGGFSQHCSTYAVKTNEHCPGKDLSYFELNGERILLCGKCQQVAQQRFSVQK